MLTGFRPRKRPEDLRSARWMAPDDLRSWGHRSRMKQLGHAERDWAGKPIIGILNTWSDLNTCHSHFRERAQEVKRGVWQAGGFPVEIPVMSLSEMFMKPSAMFYRNLLAMEVEETLRCHPIDGAVLMGGCDKTTPGLLMGAISMNLPAVYLPAGPMLSGNWRGKPIGSGVAAWSYWAERHAGNISECQWRELEDGYARSAGHCMSMGTASTMTAVTEAMGMTLPGASSIPAPHASHARMASDVGKRVVEMVWEDLKPRDILTREAFDNAIVTDMAIGGSTNAIIHLIAMAGRAGVDLPLDRFDELSRTTPVLANIQPSGEFLMQDFYDAGGLRGLLARIKHLLHTEAITVNGKTICANLEGAEVFNEKVILPLDAPLFPSGATFVLRGNLAPDGCVIKPSAAEKRLLKHRGPAVVFSGYPDMKARIDSEQLKVTPDSVLVLQSAGPLGAPSMPEWGMLPIPKKLLRQGVRDMVRISDARMSGTSYGTCVLHVAPETALGGPIALIRDGDIIELDVEQRRIHVELSEQELGHRRAMWKAPLPRYEAGYGMLFCNEITQANEGCDFRFLRGARNTPDPDIF